MSRTLGTFALGEGTPQHLAIDGKALRGSRRLDAMAVHVLSAFATEHGAGIGKMVVKPDQNETLWSHLRDPPARPLDSSSPRKFP